MRHALLALVLCLPAGAQAHFGMVIPDETMPTQDSGGEVTVDLSFSHPFERDGMVLEMPERVEIHSRDGVEDVTEALEAAEIMGAPGYRLTHTLGAPGIHAITMTPQPYWEPAEDVFIQHLTKTYLAAFDDDEGWQEPLGLKSEIVPLTRPVGVWAGTLFRGQVLVDGEPVPGAEVEVEHYNTTDAGAPSEMMITQTLVADDEGVFQYVAPAPGWWGFAALTEADFGLPHEGERKDVELGAVLWVHFEPWN